MAEESMFEIAGKAKQTSSSGSSSGSTSEPPCEEPTNDQIQAIIEVVRMGDGLLEFPLRNDQEESFSLEAAVEADVRGIEGDIFEELYDAGIENYSFEDLLDVELDGVQFVSQPPLITVYADENSTEYDEYTFDPNGDIEDINDEMDLNITDEDSFVEELGDDYDDSMLYPYGKEKKGIKKKVVDPRYVTEINGDDIDTNLLSNVREYVNNVAWETVWEHAGPLSELAFIKGRGYNHDNELDKMRHVAVKVREDSYDAEDLTEEQEEWIENQAEEEEGE